MVREDPLNSVIRSLPTAFQEEGMRNQNQQPTNQFFHQGEVMMAIEEAKVREKFLFVLIYNQENEEEVEFRENLLRNATIEYLVPSRCISLDFEFNSYDCQQFRIKFPTEETITIFLIDPKDFSVKLRIVNPSMEELIDNLREKLSNDDEENIDEEDDGEVDIGGLYDEEEEEEVVKNAPPQTSQQGVAQEYVEVNIPTSEEEKINVRGTLDSLRKHIKDRKLKKEKEREFNEERLRRLDMKKTQHSKEKQKEYRKKIEDEEWKKERKMKRLQEKVIRKKIRRDKLERQRRRKEQEMERKKKLEEQIEVEEEEEDDDDDDEKNKIFIKNNEKKKKKKKKKKKNKEKTTTPQNNSETTRLRFKYPDGHFEIKEFKSTDTIGEIRSFLRTKSPIEWKIVQSYPKVVFTEEDDESSLQEKFLSPSATLFLISPYSSINRRGGGDNPIIKIFYFPFEMIWSLLVLFFGFFVKYDTVEEDIEEQEQEQEEQEEEELEKREKNYGKKKRKIQKSRENYRMFFEKGKNDDDDDDDDRTTWNGDSTMLEDPDWKKKQN